MKGLSAIAVAVAAMLSGSVFAAQDEGGSAPPTQLTAYTLTIRQGDRIEYEQQLVSGGTVSFGDEWSYPVSVETSDGSKPDYSKWTGSWKLSFAAPRYDANGAAVLSGTFNARDLGNTQTATFSAWVPAGGSTAIFHDANGKEYVLALRRIPT